MKDAKLDQCKELVQMMDLTGELKWCPLVSGNCLEDGKEMSSLRYLRYTAISQ